MTNQETNISGYKRDKMSTHDDLIGIEVYNPQTLIALPTGVRVWPKPRFFWFTIFEVEKNLATVS